MLVSRKQLEMEIIFKLDIMYLEGINNVFYHTISMHLRLVSAHFAFVRHFQMNRPANRTFKGFTAEGLCPKRLLDF